MSIFRTTMLVALCWMLLDLAGGACAADGAQRVLAPWTPVTVKSSDAGVELCPWGRTHRFAKAALPVGIQTAGEEVLAAPIRVVGQVGGKAIEWQRGGTLVFAQSPAQATLSGWQANDDLILNTATRMDFDGMMRIDMVLLPQRGAKPKVEQLWLEVPLKAARASLYHYWPGGWGRADNSGAVPEAGLGLSFRPSVWLGWEEGGLAWFTESDKGWQPEKPSRAVEVLRQGETTVLRLHLLDSPPPQLPVTYTFGLQATPIKPMPADFHEWRIWHAPKLATTLQKSASVVFTKWWTCHRAFPDGKPIEALERAAQLGVKTVVFHEDWAPVQNYPATNEEPELKRLIDACHQRKMKVLLYFGYEISSLAPEWGAMGDDVVIKNAKGVAGPGWHRLPEQREFRVCYRSRWQDVLVDGISRFIDRMGFDGIYLDGTIEPAGCCNQAHGCGHQAADGTLHPTYPVFAVRRLMQRFYEKIHPRGGLINAHQSTCCLAPTLAFVDSYWDGEQFSGGELSGDPLNKLPLAAFRAEFMGKNFGVPCEFLAYERPPKWTFDHALAFTMLHDVRVRPHGSGELLEQMSKIWDVMTRFGVTDAQWHPYWRNDRMLTAEPSTIKSSMYLRPAAAGQKARALLVVANLSADAIQTARVNIDAASTGLGQATAAKDTLNGEALPFDHSRLSVPLQPMRMRMVWLE